MAAEVQREEVASKSVQKCGSGENLREEALEILQQFAELREFEFSTAIGVCYENEIQFELGSRCTEHTLFMTASISEVLIAVLALQASERGELDLDANINLSLPAGISVAHPAFPDTPITMRMLLQHRAGFADTEHALEPGPWRTPGADCPIPLLTYVRTRLTGQTENAEVAEWLRHEREARVWGSAEPGKARYHYSNLGFTIAGLVLEYCGGMSLGDLARKRIFDPLGMHNSSFTLTDALARAAAHDTALAVPHDAAGDVIGHYGVAEYPAAGLRASLHDLLLFMRAFTSVVSDEGSRVDGEQAKSEESGEKDKEKEGEREGTDTPVHRLLQSASLAAMLPADHRGGLAWWGCDAAYGERSGRVWTHGGFMDGVRTHVYLWRESRRALVVLLNAEQPYEEDLADPLRCILGVPA
eukprot:m.5715 g.5715  ORF g.5715 m.5715 type:complete len:415 (+) comp4598_c0_seq1:117-1361(+)